MDNIEERVPLVEGKISFSTRYAYALGHIFNDLTAAMWFSYTLLFLQRVSLLEPVVAGSLLLLGSLKWKYFSHSITTNQSIIFMYPNKISIIHVIFFNSRTNN